MANREYYGNNVPLNLVGEQESRQFAHPRTQIQSSDSQSSFGQFPNQNEQNIPSALNTTQHLPYEQDQTQWRDPTNPEYGPNGEEGEKGLGSTLVGGAGGAFVGHEVGKKSDHGVLGTIGGAIAGAFAANLASNAVKNHGNDHGNDHGNNYGNNYGYDHGYDHGHYHGHRGRLSCGERHRQRKIARLERKLDRLQ